MQRFIFLLLMSFAVFAARAQETKREEGTRQIHLDFHTSEYFPSVGDEWNKEQWQDLLKKGHVNSINIFAKCHHGYCYYNTGVGTRHPQLKFDLLKAQIEASHEIGVSTQAYVTVGWNVLDAREHPEWVSTGKSGVDNFAKTLASKKPDEHFPWGWPTMSPEGPYLEHLKKHTEELAKNYDLDGFWFDIVPVGNINYNEWSKKDMAANGVDWQDSDQAWAHHSKKMHKFFKEINAIIRKYKPEATIYYNWTTPMNNPKVLKENYHQYNTKQDLEDLPTTWAGYDVFPVRAKYYANTGKPLVAMSGKFHAAWGEFGGFKHKDAIWYEAANMMAFGASCNFGDQLHPTGQLEAATYENIGHAYAYIEQIEEYCKNASHKARTGLWVNFTGRDNAITKLLLENQINFVVANNLDDWSDLEVIVLHSGLRLKAEELQRIKQFNSKGGKLLVVGKAGVKDGKALFDFGAKNINKANYRIDYTYVTDKLTNNLVQSPFLNRYPALVAETDGDAEILAKIYEPYFDRTVEHWTSHDNTPYKTEAAKHPAIMRKGNVMWLAHDIDLIYDKEGSQVHKQLFNNAFRQLLPQGYVNVDMPSCGRMNLMEQEGKNRYIVHLTYGTPHKRGKAQVIEDLVPLHNTPLVLKVDETLKRAYLMPGNKKLKIKKDGNNCYKVIVPEFRCHKAIVFEY
ncbi:MAG: hypothetical protein N4A74_06695 [Carboxylicivirga sp.]|jgi:hypothetical protein|nr:hypothetical protein [Carboxylicivirga sp.]